MAYATNRDRDLSNLEISVAPWPAPPLNVFIASSYSLGSFDLTWDNPGVLSRNQLFHLAGVNVYRSFDSEYGPFHRLTSVPVGACFWKDQTDIEVVVKEDVTAAFIVSGSDSVGDRRQRYVFRTLHRPIVKSGSQAVGACTPDDVHVYIDDIEVPVKSVRGSEGEVEIDPAVWADIPSQTAVMPLVPAPGSKVTCTYRRVANFVKTDLLQRIFYRVTTVGYALSDSSKALAETPLAHAATTCTSELEKLDYIWREAVRRNRFILEQGGERVKVFLRKTVGPLCPCLADDYHKQPINDCLKCFGVGIFGGYEGPFDVIIAPDDAEKKIAQRESGRTVEHSYEVWTGPAPLLSHRDFLVKINNDRYTVGPVRMPTNKGMLLQQHFTINRFDEQDIRGKVPMDGTAGQALVAPVTPEVRNGPTSKPEIPDEKELKGRSDAWENTMW